MAYQLTEEDRRRARELGQQQFASSQQSAPVVKPKGNLFTNSLSTAGGILGGIGGSFFGPGIGTAAGGALGAGAGKFLENLLEGNNATEGVGMEAAFGTLGGVGKGLKAIKGATGALRSGGVKDAASILRNGPGANVLKGASADAKIKDILTKGTGSNRPDILRKVEQSNMTDAQRLAATGGDTGQAGLQMDTSARDALLASFKAKAAGTPPIGVADAVSEIAPNGLKGRIGAKLETAGNRLLGSQSNLTRDEVRKLLPKRVAPEDVFGSINKRTGLTNMDDMRNVADNLTGKGDMSLLDTVTRAAVGEAKGVDVGDVRDAARIFMEDGASLIPRGKRAEVLNQMKDAGVIMRGGSKGSLSNLADPNKVLDQSIVFREAAKKAKVGATADPANAQLADIYEKMADKLEKDLYNAPGIDKSIPMLVKSGRDDLLFKAEDALKAGSKAQAKAYQNLAKELGNAKGIADIRKMKRDFVQLDKIDEATAQARSGAGAQLGDQMQGLGRLVQKPTNLIAMPLNAATPSVGGLLTRTGRSLQGTATPSASSILGGATPGPSAMGITGMQLGGRALGGNLPGQMNGNMPTPAVPEIDPATGQPIDPAAAMNDGTSGMNGSGGGFDAAGALGAPSQSMYSRESAAADIQKDLATTGGANMDKYLKLYEFMNPEEAAGGSSKVNATTQKAIGQSANADATLKQLEGILGNAGGAGGPVGGQVSSFFGGLGLNNEAKTYNDLASGSVTQIAKALGETGAMSDSDRIAYANLIPKITDTPQVAAAKFAALRERMATAKSSALRYGAGTGVEDALASGDY